MIRDPQTWIFRILQETTEEGFAPCINVSISKNSIHFSHARINQEINIGPKTAAETFSFRENHWLATDDPVHSKPKLPSVEIGGIYGIHP